ncbi:MAG: hypothetical protein VKL39_19335 [Leptolyngbyaceae bacterium]|nr:hypothetical protein [Leptolyngbyaceae bacterium]
MVTQRLKRVLVCVSLLCPIGLLPTGETGFSIEQTALASPQLDSHAYSDEAFTSVLFKGLDVNPLEDEPRPSLPPESTLLLERDGVLELGDRVAYQDGSLYDEYEIDGQQGQQIRIQLESLDFDPYLVLMHPNGDILAQNDDIAVDNLNALLDYQLPVDGTYRVVANGFDRHSRGHYRLTVLVLNSGQSLDEDDTPVIPEH